ncbi:MAG: putative Mannose-1-phosphate guanylyltransferase [Acidobacteria bacterium]|nr:putative Mannose-1-phosphate guanylyltransferase [Acidobacteriota bacterium]
MRTRDPDIDKDRRSGAGSDTQALSNRVALLLAGGDGTRLQDLTSEISGIPIPKQYCRLMQGTSLLEAAIARAHLLFPLQRIHVVINENHIDFAKDQVVFLPASNILVQPLNRDTGPGLIFALLTLESVYKDAIVAVFPTDHYVDNNWAFVAHVMRAINTISYMPDKIALLGIVPDRPETGYGYILPANPLKTSGNLYHVDSFIEKPNSDDAQEMIKRGGLWNTLVMVFRLSRMLDLVQEIAPREVEGLLELRTSPEKAVSLYETMQPWNFSTKMLARIPQHLVVFKVANVLWSDWGTREAIERTYKALNLVPSWKLEKATGNRISKFDEGQDHLPSRVS